MAVDMKKLEEVLKLIVKHSNDHPSHTSLTSLLSMGNFCKATSLLADIKECLQSWASWSPKNLEVEDKIIDRKNILVSDGFQEKLRKPDGNSEDISEPEEPNWEEYTDLTSSYVKWWKFINEDLSEYGSDDEWTPQSDDEEEITDEEEEEEIDEDQSSRIRLALTQVKLDHLLLIPLQNVYPSLNQLSFATLSRPDLLVSELFRSINFLDVHLAVIARFASEEEKDCENEHLFWIHEWINSGNSIPQTTPFQIDLKSQLVGDNREFFDRKFLNSDSINGNEYDYPVCYYPVMIIQPRHQSVHFGCRYNFENVLNQLCCHAQLTGETKDQSLLVSLLGQILSFCREKPFCVWNDPSVDSETRLSVRARRLMELCTNLKAKKEGLELLDILRTVDLKLFPDIHTESPTFRLESSAEKKIFCCDVQPRLYCGAGILNIEVANAIADFVSQVSGWEDSSNLILDWIQPSRLNQQFIILSSLVIQLVENGCVEGSLQVAKRLSSLFSQEDFTLPQYRLDDFQIDSLNFFVNMVAFLEENPETPDPDRMSQLVAFFRRLKNREQCMLVIRMSKENDSLKAESLRYEICRQFCEIICSTGLRDIRHLCRSCLLQILCPRKPSKNQNLLEFHHNFPHLSLVKSLICSFAELKDDQLLISLLEMIFTDSSTAIEAEACWFFTESSFVFRISSSPLVKNIFCNLFDSKMVLVKKQMDEEVPYLPAVSEMLVECLHFANRMEKREPFEDPARVASFSALIPLIPMVELAQLFIATHFPDVSEYREAMCDNESIWNEYGNLISGPLFPKVCLDSLIYDEILSRDVESLFSLNILSISTLLKILYRFIEIENAIRVRTLIFVIARHGEGSDQSWDSLAKKLNTIDLIFTSAGYLADYDSLLGSEEMQDVFLASVDSIIQGFSLLLDRLEPDGLEEPVTSREFQRIANIMSFIFPVFNIPNYLWPKSEKAEKITEQFTRLFELHFLLILSVFEGSFDSCSWGDCDPYFPNLCRQYVAHRFYEKFSPMFHSQILFECFLSFDDHVSLIITCRKLCSEKENFCVKKIITSSQLQKRASNSTHGRAAFCWLLDHQLENLNLPTVCSEQEDLTEELSQLAVLRQNFKENIVI